MAIFPATSLVDRASLIGDVVVVDVLKSIHGLTSRATEVLVLTGDDDLGRDVDVGPGSLSLDLNSIRKC